MTPVLIDPTLRRARLVRASLLLVSVAALLVIALFCRGLRGLGRAPLALPAPRRGLAAARRLPRPPRVPRPVLGRRPKSGRTAGRGEPPAPTAGYEDAPDVIAFLDPTVVGALASLDRHADALAAVASVGLLVGEGGAVVDRLDEAALDVARSHALKILGVVQNLDERDGGWRPDRVAALARDRGDAARFASALADLCRLRQLAGIHLDLEEIDEDDWPSVAHLARVVAARLRPLGLELSIDVPAQLDPRALGAIAAVVDRVVVMAYDESDDEGPPGPIASDAFVEAALEQASVVPPGKLVAGLGIYGYDWVGHEPADPLSFVAALAAAKEAHVEPEWDPVAGNSHFRYSDDEGLHEVWLLDGASVWNQLGIAARHHASAVTLWRLGGEDPGVWDAIAALHGRGTTAELATVPPDERVENLGDGPFLSLALRPEAGQRELQLDGTRIVGERWQRLPSPYLVRRAGIVPGRVALTFDDGPDPRFTPAILDELRRAGVPATFFVIGVNAERAPDLVRRAWAEGHEIGNHSFTHPDVDVVGEARLQVELEATSRLVESLIGRRPLLYRPPSLADIEPRTVAGATAFARAGSLGYLVVDADVDPRDWESPSAADLTRRVLAETHDGGVVLLHDGGGDRSTTLEALPAIIDGMRGRGLSIVPLAELVGKRREEVMPPSPTRPPVAETIDRAVFGTAARVIAWSRACLVAGLALVVLRLVLVVACALVAERRRRRAASTRNAVLPTATVVIPAYNERAVIERTVGSVLASDIPVQVIVVDDGSTDGTWQLLSERFRHDHRLSVVAQPNFGKAAALQTGFAWARGEVVVALDGDTVFAPDTVRRLVQPFTDRRVGAVAGTAEVGNRENALTSCQALEYLVQQEVERRAWDAFAALPVVPGAVGAWRRRAVAEVGGFTSDTLAEDADLTMALCRAGWRVVHAPEARAYTEAPSTVSALMKQRRRWSFGVLQAMWKHRAALFDRRAGAFGRLVLPAMIAFQVLLPLLTPAALLSTVVAAVGGHLGPALVVTVALLGGEAVQAAVACVLAQRSGRPDACRLLAWLLPSRLVYRPLLFLVLVRALGRVLDGIPLGWGKLARRGTVAAPCVTSG
jgi:cellulose synthase/poly-beta-1,6-N-acetylglucosamine synthase-like glycosyltransferase/peptidoglycan/xylan/chitin deacetylase (PgdA/CDA1 family)